MMKRFHIFLLVVSLLYALPLAAAPLPDYMNDYIEQFKGKVRKEIVDFTQLAGWTSNGRGLSPSSPLGIWGFDVGVEVTSIPQKAFLLDESLFELPLAFPRLYVGKGITKNLDAEINLLAPKLLERQLELPAALESLIVAGGAFKYSLLNEGDGYLVSMAARASYTRLMFEFFDSDIYGADLSLSRELKLPIVPISLTPYVGFGYLSTSSEFEGGTIPYVAGGKYVSDAYRYFAGASLKLFIFDITAQFDASDISFLRSQSIKIGLDFDVF